MESFVGNVQYSILQDFSHGDKTVKCEVVESEDTNIEVGSVHTFDIVDAHSYILEYINTLDSTTLN